MEPTECTICGWRYRLGALYPAFDNHHQSWWETGLNFCPECGWAFYREWGTFLKWHLEFIGEPGR